MQTGGLPKAQDGRSLRIMRSKTQPLQQVQRVKKEGPIKAIKKVIKKLTPNKTTSGCFGAGCGKMELGGSLPKARNGGFAKGKKMMERTIDKLRAEKTGHQYPFPKKVGSIKKTISTIKKTISNIGKRKATTPTKEIERSL